jgi:hypothetical protein
MSEQNLSFTPRSGPFSGPIALRLLRNLCLVIPAIACSVAVSAQRRDFPATYSIDKVSEQETQVQLTLTLTIHNFSGSDIQNCGIVLNATTPHTEPIGTFNLVKLLPAYKDTTVSHSFTLDKSEYERWKAGANPSLEILLPDGDGGTRIEAIDARPPAAPVAPAEPAK